MITILGAGVAGLCAATVLSERGCKVQGDCQVVVGYFYKVMLADFKRPSRRHSRPRGGTHLTLHDGMTLLRGGSGAVGRWC